MEHVRGFHGPLPVGDHDELGFLSVCFQELGKTVDVGFIQRGVDFVQNHKRRRLVGQQGKEQGDHGERPFSPGKQGQVPHLLSNSVSVAGYKYYEKKNIKMDDGLFEALLIKSLKNPIELQQVLNALLSKQLDADNMCYLSSSFLHIISDDDVQWTLDGEDGGFCNDAYMQNIKESLPIICDRRALASVSSKRTVE